MRQWVVAVAEDARWSDQPFAPPWQPLPELPAAEIRSRLSAHRLQLEATLDAYRVCVEKHPLQRFPWPLRVSHSLDGLREGSVVLLLAPDGSEHLAIIVWLTRRERIVCLIRAAEPTQGLWRGPDLRRIPLEGWTTAREPTASCVWNEPMSWTGPISGLCGTAKPPGFRDFSASVSRKYVCKPIPGSAQPDPQTAPLRRAPMPGDICWVNMPTDDGSTVNFRLVLIVHVWNDWASALLISPKAQAGTGTFVDLPPSWDPEEDDHVIDISRTIPLPASRTHMAGWLSPSAFASIEAIAPTSDT